MPQMNSMTEVMEAVVKLTSQKFQGWQALPADFPESASFGMMCFRYVDKDGHPIPLDEDFSTHEGAVEEAIHYEWLPFGKHLVPEFTVVNSFASFQTMVNSMRRFGGTYRCDDPKTLRIGFVRYDGEKGYSYIVRMPLSNIKDAPDSPFRKEIEIGTALGMR